MTVEGEIRRNRSVLDSGEVIGAVVELVINLTNPAKTSRHRKMGGQRIVVSQQVSAAPGRKVSQTVQWIRRKDEGRVVETEIVEAVMPHAEVHTLGLSQHLINREPPVMLNVRIAERHEALVVLQAAAGTGTVGDREDTESGCLKAG